MENSCEELKQHRIILCRDLAVPRLYSVHYFDPHIDGVREVAGTLILKLGVQGLDSNPVIFFFLQFLFPTSLTQGGEENTAYAWWEFNCVRGQTVYIHTQDATTSNM